MKSLFRKIGRIFVILTSEEERILRRSVLIVDNGYSNYEHLRSAVIQTQIKIPGSDISLLTLEHRKEFLGRDFPSLWVIYPAGKIKLKKYQLAIQMFKLRRKAYNFVVLLSLDKTPILTSLLFMGSRVLLYNRWNEWYLLRFRNIWEYVTLKRGADEHNPKRGVFVQAILFIPLIITHIGVLVYLLISTFFIFLRKNYYGVKFKFEKGK